MIPSTPEIERAVLATVLSDPETIESLPDLDIDCFHSKAHREIFEAIRATGHPDLLSVEETLRQNRKLEAIGGTGFLADLMIEASHRPEYHLQILIEHKIRRQIIRLAQKSSQDAQNNPDPYAILDELIRSITGIDSGATAKHSLTPTEIFEREKNNPIAERLFTGIRELDEGLYRDTMRRGHVVLTIADSGHGKTQFALFEAAALLRQGYRIGWFQLEDYDTATAEYFRQNAPKAMDQAHICHSLYEIEAIKREARRLKRQCGVDVIYFDYTQNIEAGRQGRADQIEYISQQITRMAKDLNVVSRPLSQVTIPYSHRHGWSQEPKYGDVRWSQQLKQDAHAIISVFRPSRVDSLVINQDTVRDWKDQPVPYNSVFAKQAKIRGGKQVWNRLHLIHSDRGLQLYTKHEYQEVLQNGQ